MSKFRMKLKLQGFELEIEGNREDASVIGRSIGEQISGMIAPTMNIVDGEFTSSTAAPTSSTPAISDDTPRRKAQRRARSTSASTERDSAPAVELRNDPSKYATPTQQWSTAEKAIWLLYVVKEANGISELGTAQIVKTFNTHFRQAKTIQHGNVNRDLGKLKITSPALVGEDTTKSPTKWFLTDEGVRKVQALIADARIPAAA